jgi:hypothetical protein
MLISDVFVIMIKCTSDLVLKNLLQGGKIMDCNMLFSNKRKHFFKINTSVKSSEQKLTLISSCYTALITGLFFLAGCSTIPPQPSNLPALVPSEYKLEVCPEIAGRYTDMGSVTTEDGKSLGSVSLTKLLHPNLTNTETPDTVIVRGPERDIVEIESFKGQAQIAIFRQPKISDEIYLAKGDRAVGITYLCEKGFVRLGRSYNEDVVTPVFIIGSDWMYFRKAMDGSLIVYHQIYNTFIIGVVPVAKGTKLWYHFLPVSETSVVF